MQVESIVYFHETLLEIVFGTPNAERRGATDGKFFELKMHATRGWVTSYCHAAPNMIECVVVIVGERPFSCRPWQ